MKRGLKVFVSLACIFVIGLPLFSQPSSRSVETFVLDNFDSSDSNEWTWNVNSSRFVAEGYPKTGYYDGIPNSLKPLRRPDDPDMENFNEQTLSGDPTLFNFGNKMACLMRISAICIPDPNNPKREYRFTNWEDIEHQIDNINILNDSMTIMKLALESKDMANPADFYITDIRCPYCGRVEPRIPIPNITQNLLFQISRRLEDMELNLINLD
jgi:hypothetical protein